MAEFSYNEINNKDTEKSKKENNNKPKLKLKDGTQVPGATTICGLLDKPFLVKWANNLGKQGIDVTEYVDSTAILGTLIHLIIESHLTQEEVDLTNYEENKITEAENIFFTHYLPWEKQHKIELIFCEKQFVSEVYRYGGIIDFYCKLDDKYTIVDFKTSKSISSEHVLQVSSYIQLLQENGYQVDQILILDVKKEIELPLEEKLLQADELDDYWTIFKSLIDVYYAKKKLKWK